MHLSSRTRRQWLTRAAACALYGTFPPAGRAAPATYPQRPISIIVPSAVGAPLDLCMREAARQAAAYLPGADFRIANRPGAAKLHGATALAALDAADGYELAMSLPAWINKSLLYDVNYEPLRDFTFVTGIARAPYCIATRADAPWQDLPAYLAHARRIGGGIRYAVVGYGASGHLLMEETARQAGTAVTGVLVRTAGEMVQLLVSGQVDAICDCPAFAPQMLDASLRLLAHFGDAAPLPQGTALPTVASTGMDIVLDAVFGLAGPHGLPGSVVRSLREAFIGATRQLAYTRLLDSLWLQPAAPDGPDLAEQMRVLELREHEWMRRAGLRGAT
ncbi:hypothetical protein FOZ76_00300 [Verticiella sediminum]|uniref:Tripartite tricarboxylate transporter substrate binding protein n=1 Tax=Verticiella sediminum TaxID=1247510 RepID=A0A556B211_9BURK|nr:tripartite tricarboxylate transporter substrate-binding protein [Verticiella sediminum]TSH99209.1 hypothetical protein FOZ76_00300 [Verticiella sediminum]